MKVLGMVGMAPTANTSKPHPENKIYLYRWTFLDDGAGAVGVFFTLSCTYQLVISTNEVRRNLTAQESRFLTDARNDSIF